MRLDSFEVSKIAGALLCALLVIVGFRVALEIHEHGKPAEKPGYVLPMPEAAPAAGHGAGQAPARRRCGSSRRGVRCSRRGAGRSLRQRPGRCRNLQEVPACHSGENGGPNKVGPNLAGVVGRPKASHAGFNYSDAMKAKGGNWTLEDLASFVHSPKTFVPGTKMLFPGIADAGDLSDLLAYLNTLK